MSVELKLKLTNCCDGCGNVYDFAIGLYQDEQDALCRLKPGEHPRKLDGYCKSCRGPVTLDCTVIVRADGRGLIGVSRG